MTHIGVGALVYAVTLLVGALAASRGRAQRALTEPFFKP